MPTLQKRVLKKRSSYRDKLRGDEYVVALEVKGKPWTTEQLAQEADDWRMTGRDIVLLVGGARWA